MIRFKSTLFGPATLAFLLTLAQGACGAGPQDYSEPASRISSSAPGKPYLKDVFTGKKTHTTLPLPQRELRALVWP